MKRKVKKTQSSLYHISKKLFSVFDLNEGTRSTTIPASSCSTILARKGNGFNLKYDLFINVEPGKAI